MWYWSVAILFWQLLIDHIVNGQCKRCGFAKTRLRHPSLPFDSLSYPTRTICTRVRTLCQPRDNQKKRGWPYSMSSPAKNVCACSTKNDTWSISGNVIGSEAKMRAKCCSDERSDGSFFLAVTALQFLATVRDQKLFWSEFWNKCVL